MPQFMLLIHGNEADFAKMTEGDRAKDFQAWKTYTDDLVKSGAMRSGAPLLPSNQGASKVQVRAGKRSVVDGPFTEAKEVCGGYYLIEVASKKEAVEWAAKCPGAAQGTMEVREVMVIPGM